MLLLLSSLLPLFLLWFQHEIYSYNTSSSSKRYRCRQRRPNGAALRAALNHHSYFTPVKADIDQFGFGRPSRFWSTKSDLVTAKFVTLIDQFPFGRPIPIWSYPLYLRGATKSELVDQIRFRRPNPIWST